MIGGISLWNRDNEDGKLFALSQALAEQSSGRDGSPSGVDGNRGSDKASTSIEEETEMKEGIERMKRAAEAGNAEAQYDYAVMLYRNASSSSNSTTRTKQQQNQEIAKAIELFEKAAAGGVKEAMYNIGVLYVTGHRLAEKRVATGVEWLQKAAEAGCAPAALRLGHMHLQGAEGTPYSPSNALHYFDVAAELGLGDAQYMSGILYSNGTISPSNPNRSSSSSSSFANVSTSSTPSNAATQGVSTGNVEQTSSASLPSSPNTSPSKSSSSSKATSSKLMQSNSQTMTKESTSLMRFLQAAEQGHAAAACNAAMMLHNGIGTDVDMKEAVHWYRQAAEGGDADASALLALFHLYGYPSVVTQNVSLGLELLQLAANLNSPIAQRTLASLLLARGDMRMQHLVTPLLPPNARNAYQLLVQCARTEDNDCRSELANLIIKGGGEVDEKHSDLTLAYRLIAKAAQEGHPRAMTKKAIMQQLGIGTSENKIQAAMMLTKATQTSKTSSSSSSAAAGLGSYASSSDKTSSSNSSTYTPSTASIQSAVSAANFFLGMAYILGDGVDKSYTKGMALLNTASGLGFEPATRAIQYIKRDMEVDFLEQEKRTFLDSPEPPFKL